MTIPSPVEVEPIVFDLSDFFEWEKLSMRVDNL
jgi:hypothetical protein